MKGGKIRHAGNVKPIRNKVDRRRRTRMFQGDPLVGGSLSGRRIDGGEDDVFPMILGERLGALAAAPEPRGSSTD